MASVSFELQKPVLAQFKNSSEEAISRWDKIGVLKKEMGGITRAHIFIGFP